MVRQNSLRFHFIIGHLNRYLYTSGIGTSILGTFLGSDYWCKYHK